MNIDLLLKILSITAWSLTITLGLYFFLGTLRRKGLGPAVKMFLSIRTILILLIPISINFVSAALVFIPPPEVGVVVSLLSRNGVRDTPLRAGLHWIVPLFEEVVNYPIAWQTYTMSGKPTEGTVIGNDSIIARTKDGQEVIIDSSIIFRVDTLQVVRIHVDWQNRYIADLVRPTVRGLVRSSVAKFTVNEVNSDKRANLEIELDKEIGRELEEKGFVFDKFVLRNITFSQEYAKSVEQKQVQEQGRTTSQYQAKQVENLAEGIKQETIIKAQGEAQAIRLRAEAKAEAIIIEAQAEAEALRLVNQVLTQNRDLLTYQYVNKLSPNFKAMLLPSNNPLMLPLPENILNNLPETDGNIPAPIVPTTPITPITTPITETAVNTSTITGQ